MVNAKQLKTAPYNHNIQATYTVPTESIGTYRPNIIALDNKTPNQVASAHKRC